MLYTVTPLERIYVDTNSKADDKLEVKNKGNEEEGLKTYSLNHGNVYVKKKGKDFVVAGVQSTDMSDYLKKEYAIGEKYHIDE